MPQEPESPMTIYRTSVAVSEEDISLSNIPMEVMTLLQRAQGGRYKTTPKTQISDPNWFLPSFIKSFMHYDYKGAFEEISRFKHPTTCEWIFETEEMKWWDQKDDSQILWLTGYPGIGKSTLASHIADKLETGGGSRNTARSTVIFSFCDRQMNYTPSMILSVAIHQMLLKFDNLREFAYRQDMYQISGVSYNRVIKGKNKSASILWNLLLQLVIKSGLERVFFIIDALDVLDEKAQESLLGLFDTELKTFRSSKTRLKIFITSHPSNKVAILQSERLARFPQTLKAVDATKYRDKIDEDIDRFIQDHKASVMGALYSSSQIKDIEEQLATSGPKVFLPITLWFKQLQLSSPEEPVKTLQSVSDDLTSFYTNLISQLPSRLFRAHSPLMTFITHAYRALTIKELAFACRWEEEGLENNDVFPVQAKNPLLAEDIDRITARAKRYDPILKIERDDTVSFFHDSIRDFILQNSANETSFFVENPEKAHCNLALLCMKTMLYKSRLPASETYAANHSTTRVIPSEHVFLSYSMQFWLQHLREAVPADTAFSSIDQQILQVVKDIVQIWEDKPLTRSFRETMLIQLGFDTGYRNLLQNLTPLEVLSALGLDPFLHAYLSTLKATQSLRNMTQFIGKAVKLAIQGGHEGCFEILRETFNISSLEGKEYKDIVADSTWGGQPNLVETVLRLRRSRTLDLVNGLTAAFLRGDQESLDHLVRDRSIFQDRNHFGMTALHAIFAYHKEGMTDRVLVSSPSAIAVTLAICGFLIENGVSVSLRDNYGFTALHWACRSGHLCQKEVIEFLLERGADPHAQSITGLTPLHLAAYCSRNTDAIQCLLNWSTNNRLLGITSRGRMSPLHWAVSRPVRPDHYGEDSTEPVIEFLLRSGADIRAPNLRGITPLEWGGQYRARTLQEIYSGLQGINIIDISHDGRPDLLIIWNDWTNIRLETYRHGPSTESLQILPQSLLEQEDSQLPDIIAARQGGNHQLRLLVTRFNNRVRNFYRLRVTRYRRP